MNTDAAIGYTLLALAIGLIVWGRPSSRGFKTGVASTLFLCFAAVMIGMWLAG